MSETVTINLRFMARELDIPAEQIQCVVNLLDEGYPVPFIARYRKDETFNLGESQIRKIAAELASLRSLAERKQVILRSIESLGKLTPELDKKIRDARSAKRLEDIYLPYKPKKQTLASIARDKGLEPFALEILNADPAAADIDARAIAFINAENKVSTIDEALQGAAHILAEMFAEKSELRQEVREIVLRSSKLKTERIVKPAKTEAKTAPQATPKTAKMKGKAKTKAKQGETVTAETAAIENAALEQPTAVVTENVSSVDTENVTPVEHTTIVETNASVSVDSSTPVAPENVASPEPEDSGSGGGEPEVNAEQVTSETVPQETVVQETAVQETATPNVSEEAVSTQDNAGETTESKPNAEPQTEEEIARTFQEWQAKQLEKGIPVVKSQNQIRKKRAKEKKTRKEAEEKRRESQQDHLYRDYYGFSSDIRKIQSHRILAINRAEKQHLLRVKFENDDTELMKAAETICLPAEHPHKTFLQNVLKDSVERLVLPSIERETRNTLSEVAETQSIKVFEKNLRNLLLQPPLHRKRVLAIDPGFKHGCKVVAIDEFGNVLEHAIFFLSASATKRGEVRKSLAELLLKHEITVIAVGNGTACRETEELVSEMLASEQLKDKGISYVIVNEAGASIYSASPIAQEELPDYDILVRGTISIARRLQDPLQELVKIEPSGLGVGMYQHDIKAKPLKDALSQVIESCVNYVGVDLNTATPSILRYVSGLNQLTANRIYEYRCQHGAFRTRQELLNVPGFGPVAFTHAAGFLKVLDGDNPLDATWIHPESYELAERILTSLGYTADDLRSPEKVKEIAEKRLTTSVSKLADELGAGVHTVRDILSQLARPGRDPREALPPPVFKKGILKLDDLQLGMELTGTVLNVVDFGAFVDVGLHESGLIHISHMADRYIRDASDILSVGDVVRVWVLEIDKVRDRISLTMFDPKSQPQEHKQTLEEQTKRPPREPRERSERKPADVKQPDVKQPNVKQPESQNYERGESVPSRFGKGAGHDRKDRFAGKGRDRNDRESRDSKGPKVFEFRSQEKEVKQITEAMRVGKEPMRGFGELAQLYGLVQVDENKDDKKDKNAK
ncbi:MAG: helix-hairpin-helix domain-containing protein [Planctomycetaceae bacterium]|nr:helix-hairpin-helix domain-containing protein [Planctomycetaceae bacterium]